MIYAKKSFPKLGILIIIFAIVGIYLANSGPWIHYSAKWKELGVVDENFYKDLEGVNTEVLVFFNPPFSFIHGMFEDYFFESPALAVYGLYSLLIIGLIIIIFGFIDKKKNFPIINFHTIQFILYSLIIIPCIFIITSVIRFIQIFIIAGHNIGYGKELLETLIEDPSTIPRITPIVAYLFIIIFLAIITITFVVMDSNLRIIREESETIRKKLESTKTKIISQKAIFRYHGDDDQI